MAKTKLEFTIGDYVSFKKIVEMERKEDKRKLKVNNIKLSFGIICGAKRVFEGKTEIGFFNGEFGEYEPNYFVPEKSTVVYLVRKGMLNKPLMVRQEDVKLHWDGVVRLFPNQKIAFPLLAGNWRKWSNENKEFLRDEMKDYPRDSKGRWLSWEVIRKRQKLSGS